MKRIILTDRDNKIIEFINDFKVATTSTIANMFFPSLRTAQRRLKYLAEHGYIKAYQEHITLEKIYYIKKKPSQLKHSLILSSFIAELKKANIETLKYKVQFKLCNTIPDCLLVLSYNNKNYIYLVEVENAKAFNVKKYEDLYYSRAYKDILPTFPSIIVISNRTVKKSNKFDVIDIKLDFSNIDKFIDKLKV